MRTVLRDAQFAARALRKRPAFTAAVIATLALGIGASTAIFSLVSAALLRPLPFAEPERVVFLWGVYGPTQDIRGASPPEVRDWRTMNRTLRDVSVYDEISLNLRTADEPVRVVAEMVSAGYFDILGARAAQGRTFLAEEDATPDAHPVAVVSHALWRDRFGGDPALVGSTITLNDRPLTVVGVMPEGFAGLSFDTDVWLPMAMYSVVGPVGDLERRGGRWLGAVGRLRDGVTPEEAQRDLDAVAARLTVEHPETNTDRGVRQLSLREYYLDTTAGLLRALLAAVLLFLLLACANVVSLQLVRATAREREIALRVAVGADRRRLVQQLLTEGMLLALLGTAAGLLVALWGIDALLPLMPEGVLPRYASVALDGRVLLFSAGLALACGLIFGLVPAWRSTRPDLASSLKEGARSATGGLGGGRRIGLQETLVVAEVAIALVLLVGAGLMVRSLQNQIAVRPGFDPAGVLTARLALPAERYDAERRTQFVAELEERLRALPGVQGAAVAADMPLSGGSSAAILAVEGMQGAAGPDGDGVRFYRHRVSPGYFATLGIPIVRGRAIGPEDRRGMPPVAVVSQAMAARFWPGQDPVGRRILLGGPDAPPVTVVGVAGDVRHRDLTGNLLAPQSEPDVYFPFAQSGTRDLEIAVRTQLDAAALAPQLRRVVAAMDAGLPLFRLQPLEAAVRQQTATGRFASVVLGVFSGVALLLAAIGIYGVLAFLVGLSRREIAIRLALGAGSSRVMAATIRRGLLLALGGLVIGGVAAALVTDVLAAQLFGVSPTDPVTFGAVALALLLVALAAAWIPASRATRVDPQLALRGE